MLKGAEDLLRQRKVKFIQFEYGGTYVDANVSLRHVCRFLAGLGYALFRILPDGVLHIEKWRDALESYRLSNYLAVSPDCNCSWKAMEDCRNGATCTMIFSKDRAMQLDCTLRTLHLLCRDIDQAAVRVLYTTSSDLHERGYQKLREEFRSVGFIEEKAFKKDLLSVLRSYEYVLFLVDDCIFVREFTIADVANALARRESAIGFSLRLGRNTTYCYMHERSQSMPAFINVSDRMLAFDWTASELDFGYPLELSSSVYRVSHILPLLNRLDFKNPNTLEASLDANKSAYAKVKPELLCYEASVAFCNPANKVQNVFIANRAGGDNRYSTENLACHFMEGYRISAKGFFGFTPNSCHQEVNYIFDRPDIQATAAGTVPASPSLVTIGILNCNGLNQIKVCLESIARNTPQEHEIIIVDNGSADGSIEYLRSLSRIVLIENPQNLGPTTRNRFLALARGRYIVFLDNDTIVTKDWLTRLIRFAAVDPEIGIIGACANYASGLQLVQNTSYKDIRELEEFAASRAAEYADTLWLSPRLVTMCVLLKRELVERIGGLDEGFGMFGFEDDDFAIRATIAGFKSVVAPGVFIHHTGGPQGRGDTQYNTWLHESWAVFKKKWGLPAETQYGVYDVEGVVRSHSFDPSKHYVPLPDRGSVEKLICKESAYWTRSGVSLDGPKNASAVIGAEDHFKKALAYEGEGSADLAIEELEKVLQIDAGHAGAHNGLGVLYHRKGDIQKALQMLSKAVMIRPDDVGFLKNLAVVALEVGEAEDAIGLYKRILTLDPEDVETLLMVGHLCEQCGQKENALNFLQEVLHKEPGNTRAAEAVERIRNLGTGTEQTATPEQTEAPVTAAAG